MEKNVYSDGPGKCNTVRNSYNSNEKFQTIVVINAKKNNNRNLFQLK